MPEGMTWDAIPEPVLIDCAQLVKANSIEGEWSRSMVPIDIRLILTVCQETRRIT